MQWNKQPAAGGRVDKRAFTLIELLVVMALMIVIILMVQNRSGRSYQQQRMFVCEKNLQTMYTALSLYASDNKDVYPIASNATTSEKPLSLLIPRCTTVTEIFICPGSKDFPLPSGEPFTERRISYAYYMGLDKNSPGTLPLVTDRQVDTNPKRKGMQIFSPDGKGAGSNHDRFGGNIMAADGSVTTAKATAVGDLTFPKNVVLLNPKP